MLKILQGATVGLFVLLAVGAVLFIACAPDKWPLYKDFVSTFWPLFASEVAAAFLGKPVKEIVQGITGKNGNGSAGIPGS